MRSERRSESERLEDDQLRMVSLPILDGINRRTVLAAPFFNKSQGVCILLRIRLDLKGSPHDDGRLLLHWFLQKRHTPRSSGLAKCKVSQYVAQCV